MYILLVLVIGQLMAETTVPSITSVPTKKRRRKLDRENNESRKDRKLDKKLNRFMKEFKKSNVSNAHEFVELCVYYFTIEQVRIN